MKRSSSRSSLLVVLLSTCLTTPASATDVVLPEKCTLVPVKGPCKAMIESAYFNRQQGKCVSYYYDGCGAVKPFESLEECQRTCEQPRPAPKKRPSSGLYYDPVEDDPRYADVFRQIDGEVKAALAGHPRKGSMGFVHVIWETKKQILKNRYNIDWRTPAELNPQVLFD